jgi:iron complex transport system permease protein
VPLAHLRWRLIAWVALLSALAVAWCGALGFIGLMAPNAARAWVGADQRRLLPTAAFMGALLLLLADTAARTVMLPVELPVGIVTALLGAPAFLLLLRRSARNGMAVA